MKSGKKGIVEAKLTQNIQLCFGFGFGFFFKCLPEFSKVGVKIKESVHINPGDIKLLLLLWLCTI